MRVKGSSCVRLCEMSRPLGHARVAAAAALILWLLPLGALAKGKPPPAPSPTPTAAPSPRPTAPISPTPTARPTATPAPTAATSAPAPSTSSTASRTTATTSTSSSTAPRSITSNSAGAAVGGGSSAPASTAGTAGSTPAGAPAQLIAPAVQKKLPGTPQQQEGGFLAILAISAVAVVLWVRSVIRERTARPAAASVPVTPNPSQEEARPEPEIYRPPPGLVPPLRNGGVASPQASAPGAKPSSGVEDHYGMPAFVPPSADEEGSAET